MKQTAIFKVWLISLLIFGVITACQTEPPTLPPTPALGGLYTNQGYQHVRSGELEQALQDFKQATDLERVLKVYCRVYTKSILSQYTLFIGAKTYR